jgi:hypothetical protein
MAGATEKLDANNTAEALQVMRAVSAGAVALKSTSETLRKSLGLDKEDDLSDELPELIIRVMTDEELSAVRDEAKKRTLGFDNGLGGHLTFDNDDAIDNDIVEEGYGPVEIPN